MKTLKIKNQNWFGLKPVVLASIFLFCLTFGINAQKSNTRSEPNDKSMMRPTAEEIQNALPAADEIWRKETQALKAWQKNPASAAETLPGPPPNDMFANAEIISGASGEVFGYNIDATLEKDEPNSNGYQTVWYRWTAPANLSMTFETNAGTLSDTNIGIYMGNRLASLTTLAFSSDRNYDANDMRSRVTFIANAGTVYYIQISGYAALAGTFYLDWEINRAETSKQFNFDGNSGSRASDFGVFRPYDNYWYLWLPNPTPQVKAIQFGLSGDRLMPQDYDGDGGTDFGVWRPSDGAFYVLKSMDNTFLGVQWGMNGDIPVQGDFDGDDHADFVVWRAGYFYVQPFHGSYFAQAWGQTGDYLACGDYDGDGKTDFGVQRGGPNANPATFYILRSSDGNWIVQPFGLGDNIVVPGDFDGDGKNDIAVYRWQGPGTTNFYILRSSDGNFYGVPWGLQADIVVTGDYLGDNRSDICVWRWWEGMATGRPNHFYCLADGGFGNVYIHEFGRVGDSPVGASNHRGY